MKHIRNFSIIAHIDHGKSTLSDRILEMTQTVEQRKMRDQLLDQMELEQERGITIKMQPVKIEYQPSQSLIEEFGIEKYMFNLIDTPGHVDFTYEVSRSLAAVEGAILLVDATQGIQAQTIANVYLALDQDLTIIPAVNKVDLPGARVADIKEQICQLLGVSPEEIFEVSGKTGQGVRELLDQIVRQIPAPQYLIPTDDIDTAPFRALIFDSHFDSYKGVIAHVRVFDGSIKEQEKIRMFAKGQVASTLEVGVFKPLLERTGILRAGEIGYIATGLKDAEGVRVGDTIITESKIQGIHPLAEYKEPIPVVYASIFPESTEDYNILRDALIKLKLQDSSLTFDPESKDALGKGFRCGFLGMLHLDIITERLKREWSLDLVISTPSVSYRVIKANGDEVIIYSPSDLPEPNMIETIYEPWVKMEVMTPNEYVGAVMDLTHKARGEFVDTEYLTSDRVNMRFYMPLSKIIVDFYDQLKSATSGYASTSYEPIEERVADVVKMNILVAGDSFEALSQIVYKDEAHEEGKRVVHKLKESLPRQMYTVALQAAIGGKIVARETLSAFRKDVTAKLYGGDRSRKDKLLKKQKEGKKRLASQAKISIPKEVYLDILKK